MKSFISHGVQNNIIKLNIDCTNERSKSIDYTGTEDLTIRLEKYGTLKKKLFKEARGHTISSNTDVVFRNKTKIDFVSCCKTKEGVDMNNQKKVNQDAYIEMKNVLHLDNFHIYGVLDGHGINGHFVSGFVKDFLISYFCNYRNYLLTKEELIQSDIMNNKDNPLKSFMNEELLYKKLTMDNYEFIKLAFTLAEKTLNSTAIDVINSGTTCLLVIIVNNYLITANVGDSRAIMIQDNNAVSLTIDHKPDLPLEMERIIKRGGEVSKEEDDVTYRVWVKGHNFPGIAMSRSIGDTIASSVGVISEPEIISYEINEAVSAIIMASDGVWEFLENSQVFELIKPSLEKKNPELGCKTLIKVSRKFWKSEDVTVDDITVLLIYFV